MDTSGHKGSYMDRNTIDKNGQTQTQGDRSKQMFCVQVGKWTYLDICKSTQMDTSRESLLETVENVEAVETVETVVTVKTVDTVQAEETGINLSTISRHGLEKPGHLSEAEGFYLLGLACVH